MCFTTHALSITEISNLSIHSFFIIIFSSQLNMERYVMTYDEKNSQLKSKFFS